MAEWSLWHISRICHTHEYRGGFLVPWQEWLGGFNNRSKKLVMVHLINGWVVYVPSLYTWLMIDYLSWSVKFVPGNFNLLFGMRIFVYLSLKSTKSKSRGHYGQRRCYVMKFCLSSGQHWVFGVVNNYSTIAHVIEVLDNTKHNRINDVVTLLTLWVCS